MEFREISEDLIRSRLGKIDINLFNITVIISSVMVVVRFKINVRVLWLGLVVGLGLGLIINTSRKSRTASYLALLRIWYDTG